MDLSFIGKAWFSRVFLAIYLIIGLCVLQDYGISWDEPLQRNHGLVSTDYVNEIFDNELFTGPLSEDSWDGYPYKDHGVIFQLASLAIEKGFGIEHYRSIFLIRHYLGFFIFFIGTVALYGVFRMRWDRKWALLGIAIYILTPRIFAHSFFNPKDSLALSWYCLCIYSCIKFLEMPNWKTALVHALCTALMVNSRLFGVYVIASTVGLYLLMRLWQVKFSWKDWKGSLLTIYVVFAVLFIHLIWPNMWEDPINNLYYGLRRVSKYHWIGDILFRGHWVPAQSIPFYYLPYWIGITIPVLTWLFAVLGLAVLGVKSVFAIKKPFDKDYFVDVIVLILTVGPMIAVIVKESVMYDGWRHMYFVYSGLVYFAIYLAYTAYNAMSRKTLKYSFVFLLSMQCVVLLVGMIRTHPHQNVHFNLLVQQPSIDRYAADYWGTSFKQLLEQLDEKYPNDELILYSRSEPLYFNYLAASDEVKSHIQVIAHDEFPPERNYVFCSVFRGKYDQFEYRNNPDKFAHPLVEIVVNGNTIAGAYKIH